VTINPHPERFLGSGTAFIAWHPDESAYFGYWDSSSDGTRGAALQELIRPDHYVKQSRGDSTEPLAC
jgi:hypothetical protein